MSSHERSVEPDSARPHGGRLRCDFCGQETSSVRRVAIDRSYERLRTPHVERYACAACSEKKERTRLGLDRPERG
jgi:hypothetical protein